MIAPAIRFLGIHRKCLHHKAIILVGDAHHDHQRLKHHNRLFTDLQKEDVVYLAVAADPTVAKTGAYKYEDGTRYVGDWNSKGQKHGMGHLVLPDGTRYDGSILSGLCSGLGVMSFPDGAKYEGEFMQGWFHGYGVFWRADGMKFEGEFRGGRVWGLGLVTFSDGSNGFPRNEGYFQDCRMIRRKRCPEVTQRAQKVAYMARAQCQKM